MRLQGKSVERIDFSKGIDAWNKEVTQGTDAVSYAASNPYRMRPCPDGYVDDIMNFIFDEEGKLLGRDSFFRRNFTAPWHPDVARDEEIKMLVHSSHKNLLFGIYDNATKRTYQFFTSSHMTPGWSYTFPSAMPVSVFAIYYNEKWYVYTDVAANNGLEVPSSTYVPTAFTLTYPVGDSFKKAIVWKDRVFIMGASYIIWSKATDPKVFSAPDGGFVKMPELSIRDFIIYNDSMYILTTENSVYQFSFTSDPATDGFLRKIIDSSSMPGGAYGNFAISNGDLFCTGATNIYRIINNYPLAVADSLHLELNGHDEINIWDCGRGLLLRTYYWGAGGKNEDIWFMSHSNGAWTRLKFPYYQSEADSDNVFIRDVFFSASAQYNSVATIFLDGSAPAAQGVARFPLYQWYVTRGYFGDNRNDQILASFDGNGTRLFQMVKHRISTGILYQRTKEQYKRYWHFVLDASLKWRKYSNENNTPYKTTVEFVPTNIPDKVDSSLARTTMVPDSDNQYIIPINQRARGVRLVFETEDTVTWNTYQMVDVGGDDVDAIPVVNDIFIVYEPIERNRFLKSSTALVDSGSA